jgi:hypothetical protein
MRYLFLFLFSLSAHAQVVLSCDDGWGSSDKCGGCSGLVWRTPAPNIKVKTNASDFWVKLSTLRPNDKVFTHATKKDGEPAKCSDGVTTKVSALSITAAAVTQTAPTAPAPSPPAPPPPAPSAPAKPATLGTSIVSWTAPPLDTKGRPSVITGYHIRWNGGEVIVGNVLTYTLKAPAGNYSVTVSTMNGKEESAPSKPVTFVIADSK